MSKIFVIAGNKVQADQWIKSNLEKRKNEGVTTLSWSDYVVVTGADRLRGIQDPHGVFVGTWRDRTDIFDVVQALMMQQTHPSPSLIGIYKTLRPTPKVNPTHLNGTWSQRVQEAADDLAKEIDEEVLRTLLRKVNGGSL